jgi:hypothetical protein
MLAIAKTPLKFRMNMALSASKKGELMLLNPP